VGAWPLGSGAWSLGSWGHPGTVHWFPNIGTYNKTTHSDWGTATCEKFSDEKVSESPDRLPKRSTTKQSCPAKRGVVRTKRADRKSLFPDKSLYVLCQWAVGEPAQFLISAVRDALVAPSTMGATVPAAAPATCTMVLPSIALTRHGSQAMISCDMSSSDIMNKFEFVGTFSTGRFYSNVREKRKSQNVQKRTKFWLSGKLCKNNFPENYVSGQIP